MAGRYERLTRKAIRALDAGEAITERGITAQRTPKGDIRYSINVMADGMRIHRVIGLDKDGVTRTDAEKFIETARTRAREERLQLPKGRKTHLGFGSAADLYIEREERSGGRNLKEKKRMLRLHLKPYFRDQRIDKISKFTLGKYIKQRRNQGAAPGTINHELKTLSHLWTRAVEYKWIRQRPAKIEKLDEGDSRIIALGEKDADALLKAAIADQDDDLWLFVMYGLNCGMRHREILRSRFDQIDWNRKRQHIPKAKAGERWQPLTAELVATLKKEREMRDDPDGWIFPAKTKTAKKPHRDRISRGFKRAVIRADLDPAEITPHTLRHTVCTRLIESGVGLLTAKKISGHKTTKMLERYVHLADAHVDHAASILGTAPKETSTDSRKKVVHLKTNTGSSR